MVDRLVMLKAPSFDAVFRWRVEQEQKLLARFKTSTGRSAPGLMSEHQIHDFIQHFQRITEHSLEEMPARVDHLFQLDRDRNISVYSQQGKQS
jgi:D-glycerate 3-kinase